MVLIFLSELVFTIGGSSQKLVCKGDVEALGDGDVSYTLPVSREVVWYELDKLQRLAFKVCTHQLRILLISHNSELLIF